MNGGKDATKTVTIMVATGMMTEYMHTILVLVVRERRQTHGWNPGRALQRRCGSRYVNPANASHFVDVLVSP